MRHKLITLAALALLATACAVKPVGTHKTMSDWAEYVNPMGGTLSTFNRCFRSKYGASPAQWRRQW